ncbi:extensin-1-like [Lucilia cuprina]|uniref:extensin-1-like n=1 Tax=Lucilia cuprina TaxID=7375 RepID=UPI001F06F7DA|nr:extensin-1-like [Lucilia cuprina]
MHIGWVSFFLALFALAYADVSHLGYDYQAPSSMAFELPQLNNNYLPPVAAKTEPLPVKMYLPPAPVAAPKKTYIPPVVVKTEPVPVTMYLPPAPIMPPKNTYIPPKPHNDYLPPVPPKKIYLPTAPAKPVQLPTVPTKAYLPPAPVAPQHTFQNSYLPPAEESAPAKRIITPPAPRLEDLVPPQPPQRHYEDSEVFTEDGYKTVRKHKY